MYKKTTNFTNYTNYSMQNDLTTAASRIACDSISAIKQNHCALQIIFVKLV